MIFEVEDDDLREIFQLARGTLRKKFYPWAVWCGLRNEYDGWAQDQISMGVAIAYQERESWDRAKYPSFTDWVCRKIENQAKAALRKLTRRKRKQREVDASVLGDLLIQQPVDGFETCIRQDSLKGVVQNLNPVMQAVIALYYLGGLTDLEISQFLKMNLATVQSHRQRALERARRYYLVLHSPKTPEAPSPPPPRTRSRKPRDSTESAGDEPPSKTRILAKPSLAEKRTEKDDE